MVKTIGDKEVVGSITANGFSGDGSGLSNIPKNVTTIKTYSDLNDDDIILFSLPAESTLLSFYVNVSSAFDGGTSVPFGTVADTDLLLGSTSLASTGLTKSTAPPQLISVSADTDIQLEWDAGALGTTTWSAGGLVHSSMSDCGVAGTKSAGLMCGGSTGTLQTVSQEYNGTSWASNANLNVAVRIHLTTGTQSAGLSYGGRINGATSQTANTEEYNGTSWSSGGTMGTSRGHFYGGIGTQTDAVCAGGRSSSATDLSTSEEYNGTSWSAGGALSGTRTWHGNAGTSSSDAFVLCDVTISNSMEIYDGASWSAGGNYIISTYGLATGGNSSTGWAAGGDNSGAGRDASGTFDGTSWSTDSNNLPAARFRFPGAGGNNTGMAICGNSVNSSSYSDDTYERTQALPTVLTQGSLTVYALYG